MAINVQNMAGFIHPSALQVEGWGVREDSFGHVSEETEEDEVRHVVTRTVVSSSHFVT